MKTPTREVRDLVERLICEVHDLHERSLSSPPLDSRREPPKVISDNPRALGSAPLARWHTCVCLSLHKKASGLQRVRTEGVCGCRRNACETRCEACG